MTEYFNAHKQAIQDNTAFNKQTYLNLFRAFCSCNFSDYELYNSFIMGFGQSYNDYSVQDLIHFCSSLRMNGLRQEDIFNTVMQSLNEANNVSFGEAYMPMLLNILHMDLQAQYQDWNQSVESKFGKPANELLHEATLSQKIELLNSIIAL